MLNINIKPQNRNRVFVIFALGGLGGIIAASEFKGIIAFVVDGGMVLVGCVLLGMLTSKVFNVFNFDPFRFFNPDPKVIEPRENETTVSEIEDRKDGDALNFGILWAILFLFI